MYMTCFNCGSPYTGYKDDMYCSPECALEDEARLAEGNRILKDANISDMNKIKLQSMSLPQQPLFQLKPVQKEE